LVEVFAGLEAQQQRLGVLRHLPLRFVMRKQRKIERKPAGERERNRERERERERKREREKENEREVVERVF